MAGIFTFRITTSDLVITFSCDNHKKRIGEIMKNLMIGEEADDANRPKMMSRFVSKSADAEFWFDGVCVKENSFERKAVFFENTDYPIIVKGKSGKSIGKIEMFIADHKKSDSGQKSTINSIDGDLFGSLNFRNQVGETDFTFRYLLDGEEKEFRFATEVLSYKLDYRTDARTIILEIEREYEMLSYSFLRDTYLRAGVKTGESTELIWWQIFQPCYDEIVSATRLILNRPRRRLRSVARFERAERLAVLPRDMEHEYEVHRDAPGHLYRTEELVLSHDTVENRFLKHALHEMHQKFLRVRSHIRTSLSLEENEQIGLRLDEMSETLKGLCSHPFFRGIGAFKGFSQDSLVMKQAQGYRTILVNWIVLQQGYDFEESLYKLEVKDISELYEIWCFIKIKNLVQDVIKELCPNVSVHANGKTISHDFIPKLIHGGSVSFLETNGIELASVSYNAQISKGRDRSAIRDTRSLTTMQRPDIVLRLSKEAGEIRYTYLFDAKYRVDDNPIGGYDVPPEDAINQMHRYRDAVYFEDKDASLKKEVVAGYILFPGNVPQSALLDGSYYYERANKRVGIGAFPLRPNGVPYDSEDALKRQIRAWLMDDNVRETLLETAIPQKGLEYVKESKGKRYYFISSIDPRVNDEKTELENGCGKVFISGYSTLEQGINFKEIRYLLVATNHKVHGVYEVESMSIVDMSQHLAEKKASDPKPDKYEKGYNRPYRIKLMLGKYAKLDQPFGFGLDRLAAKGMAMTKKEFKEYCEKESGHDA